MELPAPAGEPWVEPALPAALLALSEGQRTAVVLVHGFGWTLQEVAELTGVRKTSVQNHLERGVARLRVSMEASDHA
jgi:DNA-directed RNA polymerase specialized sigma24 family protein